MKMLRSLGITTEGETSSQFVTEFNILNYLTSFQSLRIFASLSLLRRSRQKRVGGLILGGTGFVNWVKDKFLSIRKE
ncbi:MAG: hypothetical protein HYV59_07905 [Planctomycetes bacterium]|nr:hypothetical protein [Planctomycetota bacterium]